MSIVAVDTSEPDMNGGKVGRGRYAWIREQFRFPADLRVFVLHHHLVPIPGTGRERSICSDAGDMLEVLLEAGVDLVLSGHKHVPWAWRVEDMFVVNAGTVSTTRLRGRGNPCYNIIEVVDGHVSVDQKFPYHGRERMVEFDPATASYRTYLRTGGATREA
jgi:3',5'-cyclic AMP phosphodiesterase CpdA